MSLQSGHRQASRASLSRLDVVRESYMASVSTVYGGNADDSEGESYVSDVGHVRNPPPPPCLNSSSARKLRRSLKFFFMNPIQKWHSRRRFPWKLLVQIVKVAVVTIQLCIFADNNILHNGYLSDTRTTFSHLFLKGWHTTNEILSYPPNGGPMAVYKQSEFYEYLDFAISNFAQIHNVSMGTFAYMDTEDNTIEYPSFCVTQYSCVANCTGDEHLSAVYVIKQSCIVIPPSEASASDWSLRSFLETHKFTIDFNSLLKAEFSFVLKAFTLTVEPPDEYPSCHRLESHIVFDNVIGGSQMLVELDLSIQHLKCHGELALEHRRLTMKVWKIVMDVLGLIVCVVSLILCTRSLHAGGVLRKKTSKFFENNIGRCLTPKEKREFTNMWYVMICVDDILLIAGSLFSLGLETGTYKNYELIWRVCSICLGLGNMLAWIGVLRYLGFFETYNVMILTLKKCAPNVLRLSVCILLIFFAYTFCGWMVLGPYHFKFQTFLSAMECLYSLINGDDMYASFFSTSGLDPVIWYFSRIYLYSFISLFMWVILSIFLAVIMDAYETIKGYYENGFPRTGLMKFVGEYDDESASRDDDEKEYTLHDTLNSFCCCLQDTHRKKRDYQRIR